MPYYAPPRATQPIGCYGGGGSSDLIGGWTPLQLNVFFWVLFRLWGFGEGAGDCDALLLAAGEGGDGAEAVAL